MSNGINQLCGHKSCSKLAKNHMKFDELRVYYDIKLLHFPPWMFIYVDCQHHVLVHEQNALKSLKIEGGGYQYCDSCKK